MVNFPVNIIINPGTGAGTRAVEGRLKRVENRADALRSSLRRAFLVLGGGALLIGTIRTLARFEQSMSTVKAVTGATEAEFAKLRETAAELGITTRFTASQAADAMVNLARAGFSVVESIEAVGGTLQLAQAGGLGLAQAADIAASTLRGFRLEVDQTGRVTDVLTLAANSANTTVGQLGDAIKFVAPVAAGLNITLEQTAAALGTLSDAGLKATLAGTGLRRVLAELESPSNNTRKILAQLGVTAEEVEVSQVGLVGALEALAKAGVDTGLALEIFGQRGGPAFEVLVNNIPRIREFTGALENAKGTAAEIAEVMDDNLNGALLRVKSAFEGITIALGEAGASSVLTDSLNELAAALRFVAANADTILLALELMAGVMVAKLIPSIVASSVAIKLLTAPGPFVALGLAVVAANIVFKDLKSTLEEIERINKDIASESFLSGVSAQITAAQRDINNINRAIDEQAKRGVSASTSQVARLEQLRQTIARVRGDIGKQAQAQRDANAAQEAAAPSIDNALKSLDRQLISLQKLNRETEVEIALQKEIDKLLTAGIVPDAGERQQLERRLGVIQSLENQKRILEEIKGPQEQFAQDLRALNALQRRGRISAEEYTAKLSELKGELDEVATVDPFKSQLDSLRESNELLSLRLRRGPVEADTQRILNDLAREGVEINDEIRQQVEAQVQRKAILTKEQEALNKAKRDELQVEREQERLSQQAERRIESLTMQIDQAGTLAERERELNEVLRRRPDLAREIGVELQNLQLRALESSTALEDGFTRAFIKISKEAEDLAAVGESVVGVFADNATDALTMLALEGELSFKKLATSIVEDLTRIVARLLVVQALNAVFGGGGGAIGGLAGGALSGGREHGGTVQPGRSFLVGERGPELLIPDRTGTVVPNQASAPAAPPEVNVQVVNVQSEDDVAQAIDSGGSDESILNVLTRNPDRVRSIVGG